MKTTSLKLSALASAFILAGCGGSSTTDTAITDTANTDTSAITTDSLSKITGTVPGTLIEAFCADGSYYSVKSTDNNTAQHPFEIEIPSTVSCSLVMTTNEDDNATKVVTQIGMITPNASGTLFTAAGDIDLGYIPLAMDPSDINDTNGDHVSDDILNIKVDGTSIVVELENPLDDDDDGLINVYEDNDDDGISNHDDLDDDDDDIDDTTNDTDNDGDHIEGNDNDHDDDGIDNDSDVDDDNDGLDDEVDSDDDNDGIDDYLDSDDDNDGIADENDSDSDDENDSDSDDENDSDSDDENDSDSDDENDSDSDDENDADSDDENDSDSDDNNDNTTTDILVPTTYKADAGRLLGSQCAQCHGTNGVSSNEWDSIAGEDDLANEIFEDDEPIMSAQAHGYTSEEILLIGNWLKTLNSND